MTTALVILAIAVALACPAHMLWRMRRGENHGATGPADRLEELRRRKAAIEARIRAGEQQLERDPTSL